AFEPLAPGETAWFRWQFSNADGDGGSLRSGLAVNNLVISIAEPTSTQPESDIPLKVTLDQNYPNPFNPATNITFTLAQSEHVQLHVYNMQGQRVATLVNEQRSSGSHNVTFNAENLASGLYMYRLQAGSASITKIMMLVK
ncbi:MAG: T9SS C-terminal target domain-containing protein, partial [Balneolaceae bacterium]